MNYKLVIFDLDGTILNTLKDLQAACNYTLHLYGLPPITLEQTQMFIGNGIRNLLVQASKNHQEIDSIVASFKKYYSSHYSDYTTIYKGIEQVFFYCKEKNIKLGVLTNKVEDIAKKLVDKHFPNQMDFVYGEVPGRARKPNEEFLLSVIKKYGYKKEDVLYIGDSEVDIKLCQNARLEGVFVSYGFRSKKSLSTLTNRIVDTPLEILNYIGEDEYGY